MQLNMQPMVLHLTLLSLKIIFAQNRPIIKMEKGM